MVFSIGKAEVLSPCLICGYSCWIAPKHTLRLACVVPTARPRGQTITGEIIGNVKLHLHGSPPAARRFWARIIAQCVLVSKFVRNGNASLLAFADGPGKISSSAGRLGKLRKQRPGRILARGLAARRRLKHSDDINHNTVSTSTSRTS